MDYGFHNEKVCEQCGKVFIPAVEHIYKDLYKGKVVMYCGWNCTCKFRRNHPVIGSKRGCLK